MKNKLGFTIASLSSLLTFAIGLTMLSTLLMPISNSFNIPIDRSGILFTANFLGFIIFNIIFSIFASRGDMRKTLIISMALYSIFLYLSTKAQSFNMLLIYTMLAGGVGGLAESISSTMVVEINKSREGFYFNFTQAFFGLGAIIGPLLSGYLDGLSYSWKLMFEITAALGIVSVVLLCIFDTDSMGKRESLKPKDIGKIFSIREFNLMIIAMMLYVGAETGVWGWISTLLKLQFKITPLKSSLSVAVFWSFMIIGRIITAKLSDNISLRKIILLLSVLGTVFTLMSAFSKSEIAIWVLLCLIGLSYSGIWPSIVAYSGKVSGKYSTSAYFLTIAAGGIGGMIIPYFLGILGKAVSVSTTLGTISVIIFGVVISTLLCRENMPIHETYSERRSG